MIGHPLSFAVFETKDNRWVTPTAAYPRLFYDGWIEGGMIFEVLTNASYGRITTVDWYWAKPLLFALNYVVWSVELLAPLLLWVPRFRTPIACTLIALHLGLEFSATIGWWQILMAIMLITFPPIPWVERVLSSPSVERLARYYCEQDESQPEEVYLSAVVEHQSFTTGKITTDLASLVAYDCINRSWARRSHFSGVKRGRDGALELLP